MLRGRFDICFFFQAEDGIRDYKVTGVQTCALPISSKIKTHHNVGLPENLPFRLIEPLRYLFKDEVREVGAAVGLPEEIVWRHPFPGPGLSIRVLGEVTQERLETLRAADAIVMQEVRNAGLYRQLWQSFAVLTL